jgi:UDP-glucose:(heptosyl)LPS alpha-1,3-glucosyltransferase
MKVALIRSKFTYFGGAEKFVDRALEALVLVGAQPTLICQSWKSTGDAEPFPLIQTSKPKGLTRTARARNFAASVHTAVQRHAFELVQTHERIPGFDVFRAGDGVHRVWLAQRAKDIGWQRRWLMWLDPFHRYQLTQEKLLYEAESLRAVICNSHMVKQEILTHFNIDAQKVHVLYNGIDTEKFRPPKHQERAQAKRQLGLSAHEPVLVFLGAGFERKGVHHLLKALALCPGMRLMVVGSDKHIKRYQKLAQKLGIHDRVMFTGPQKDPLPYLWAADGMVFPTLYDPCPNAVLEGMACGLGIITSPHCGAMELLNESSGICVSPWDHQGMADAMKQFKNLEFALKMGQSARVCVESLTLQAMGHNLLKLYQSLVAKN